jgi:predicted dehydrogenase
MKEKIGIGIIGTGFARKTQIPAFMEIPEAKIVSIASGHIENAESTAKEFGIEHFTDDCRETLNHEDIDLVCITTPPFTHKEMTLRAIELGKHILCEKPMAMNSAQAREMTERAKEKGVLALIDHELRFLNGRQKAFEMLREDKIGKVIHAKYHFANSSRGDESRPWSWWSDEDSGGGTLGAIGSHVIDTFRWFLDTEVSEVFCRLHTHVKQRPDEKTGEKREVTSDDETLLILKFGEGGVTQDSTAIVSLSMVEAGKYRNAVEFFGTKGALRIEDNGEIFHAEIGKGGWNEIEVELEEVAPKMQVSGWSRGFMNFSREIISAILDEKTEIKHAATFSDGLQTQRVLDAARESDKSGKTVIISENS